MWLASMFLESSFDFYAWNRCSSLIHNTVFRCNFVTFDLVVCFRRSIIKWHLYQMKLKLNLCRNPFIAIIWRYIVTFRVCPFGTQQVNTSYFRRHTL